MQNFAPWHIYIAVLADSQPQCLLFVSHWHDKQGMIKISYMYFLHNYRAGSDYQVNFYSKHSSSREAGSV